jgi:hypothetical protein
MKRTLIALMTIALCGLYACGGSSGTSDVSDATTTGAPTIEAVAGSGAGGEVLDTLVVTGTNFDGTMEVFMVGNSSTKSLTFTLESETKFSAALPTDIVPGDFDLEVQNDFGKATAPLSLLQGEPGISLAHYYSCPGSGDLDPTADTKQGSYASIYEFSDGSMFIACESSILYNATAFWDYSTAVAFVPGNLVESMGYVACIPMYVMGSYSPSDNGIRWALESDPSVYVDAACSTVY